MGEYIDVGIQTSVLPLSIITIRGLGVTEIQYQIDQLMLWFGCFEREIKNFDKELLTKKE